MKIFKGGKAETTEEGTPEEKCETQEKKSFTEWVKDKTPDFVATTAEIAADVAISLELGIYQVGKEALRKGWFKKPDYRLAAIAILAQAAVSVGTSGLAEAAVKNFKANRASRKKLKDLEAQAKK